MPACQRLQVALRSVLKIIFDLASKHAFPSNRDVVYYKVVPINFIHIPYLEFLNYTNYSHCTPILYHINTTVHKKFQKNQRNGVFNAGDNFNVWVLLFKYVPTYFYFFFVIFSISRNFDKCLF